MHSYCSGGREDGATEGGLTLDGLRLRIHQNSIVVAGAVRSVHTESGLTLDGPGLRTYKTALLERGPRGRCVPRAA